MKNAVYFDVTPNGSSKNLHFGGNIFLSSLLLLDTANVVPSSPILDTLMTKVIGFLKMSVLASYTRYHIPEDGILHNHHRKNLKS
jgi:hypothetical protein